MKLLSLFACAFLGLLPPAYSASVVVQWSTVQSLWNLHSWHRLSAGTPIAGDGALLQLGYFSQATLGNPFEGMWTVLAVGSIGDQGDSGDGFFSISTTLIEGSFVPPAVGTPLGVRFFDGTSIADSSYFNTAVNIDGTGLWQVPSDPAPAIDLVLSKEASRFEGHPIDWETSIPVPEASALLLGAFVLGSLAVRRSRINQ